MQNIIAKGTVPEMTTNPSRDLTDAIIELIDSFAERHQVRASVIIVDDQVMFHRLHLRQLIVH